MLMFNQIFYAVKCNSTELENEEQLFGSVVTLHNLCLDPMCLWGLSCVVRVSLRQPRNQFQVVAFLCFGLVISYPPSLPYRFSTDFVSVMDACFSSLPLRGCCLGCHDLPTIGPVYC